MIPNTGFLRIHLIEAHFEHKVGGPLHKMNPYVHLHAGMFQNWRSPVCPHGNKNPRWGPMNHFDIDVKHVGQTLKIECKDDEPGRDPLIACAEVPLQVFARPGGHQEWVSLIHNGRPGGRIHFRSEFVGGPGGVVVQQQHHQPPPVVVVQ